MILSRAATAFAAACLLFLAGCSSLDRAPADLSASAWGQQSQPPHGPVLAWERQSLPGKTEVTFVPTRFEGRDALSATAVSAASVVRKRVRIEPSELGRLRFSWHVPALIPSADLARRDGDDSPVRIILAFEGDRSRLSMKDQMLSELARTLTGEEMPYATLMYVWCNKRPAGSVVPNPRTDRIRKLVLESGPDRLSRWLDYERDVRADFEKAFGEAPGALVGIAVMTDSDNTKSTTQAWYGPVHMVRAGAQPPR